MLDIFSGLCYTVIRKKGKEIKEMIEMYRLVFADGVCSPWTTDRLENEEAAKWWNECTEHSCEIETRTFNFLVKY